MIITALCQTIIVRYARKPIWFPTAKSKLFRIPEHTFYSEDEVKQIRKLQIAYAAQEESIKEFMKHEFYIPATQAGGLPMEFVEKENELDRQLAEENAKKNAEIALEKEEYFSRLLKELEDKVIEAKLSKEDQLIEAAQKADEFVRQHKADKNVFVTPENIEAMIDKAIENPISYEFFIDRAGRQYR